MNSMRKRVMVSLFAMVLAVTNLPLPAYAAKKITTPYKDLPKETDVAVYTVTVNSNQGEKQYRIFRQSKPNVLEKNFIAMHGCAVSALTTVLSGNSVKYANYTPKMTYTKLEKKVFGQKVWKSNYKKSLNAQRPVSLYGISRILKKVGIKNKYVRSFKDKTAVAAIKAHLYKGKPVIIEANNHTQKNGRFSSSYNVKWASSKHTLVLLGMTDKDTAIVADSATRSWSGTRQRVKFAKVESLVRYMIPCRSKGTSCYYKDSSSCGGYILVK